MSAATMPAFTHGESLLDQVTAAQTTPTALSNAHAGGCTAFRSCDTGCAVVNWPGVTCSMLLMKVCGCEQRGVSSTNATHVGNSLLANAWTSAQRRRSGNISFNDGTRLVRFCMVRNHQRPTLLCVVIAAMPRPRASVCGRGGGNGGCSWRPSRERGGAEWSCCADCEQKRR